MKNDKLKKVKKYIFENEHYLFYSIVTSIILVFIMILYFRALSFAYNRDDNTFTIGYVTKRDTIIAFGLSLLLNIVYF